LTVFALHFYLEAGLFFLFDFIMGGLIRLFNFTMGRHNLLVQSAISTVARNAAANKQIMADAQTARAAYSKRYSPFIAPA
jgi:hypothetical protein